jgi:hypothetical protein
VIIVGTFLVFLVEQEHADCVASHVAIAVVFVSADEPVSVTNVKIRIV